MAFSSGVSAGALLLIKMSLPTLGRRQLIRRRLALLQMSLGTSRLGRAGVQGPDQEPLHRDPDPMY